MSTDTIKKLEKTLEELDLSSENLRRGVKEVMEKWRMVTASIAREIDAETCIHQKTDYYTAGYYLCVGDAELRDQYGEPYDKGEHFSNALSDKQLQGFIEEFPRLLEEILL